MTQFSDLDNDLAHPAVTAAQVAAVVRLIATQPDADALATVLGLNPTTHTQPKEKS